MPMSGDAHRAGPDVVVQLRRAESRQDWLARCRRVEELGYAGISLPDHLGDQLAPLVALAAAATVTDRVALCTNVLAVDFRHPVVLAHELATLDELSGGRVVAGIGAGWMRSDYEVSGIELAPAGERIRRTVEAVAVLRRHWPSGTVLMGGGGRRVLTEAARWADVVGLALDNRAGSPDSPESWQGATAEAVARRVGWVREAAAGRDDDRGPPRLSLRVLHVEVVATAAQRRAAGDALAARTGLGPEEAAKSPHVLIGTVEEIAAHLERQHRELGIGEWVVSEAAMEPLAPVVGTSR